MNKQTSEQPEDTATARALRSILALGEAHEALGNAMKRAAATFADLAGTLRARD